MDTKAFFYVLGHKGVLFANNMQFLLFLLCITIIKSCTLNYHVTSVKQTIIKTVEWGSVVNFMKFSPFLASKTGHKIICAYIL